MSNAGIRSTSFKNDLLTIGTGGGAIFFYDLRADKHLDSGIHSNRTVILRTNRGCQKNTVKSKLRFEVFCREQTFHSFFFFFIECRTRLLGKRNTR